MSEPPRLENGEVYSAGPCARVKPLRERSFPLSMPRQRRSRTRIATAMRLRLAVLAAIVLLAGAGRANAQDTDQVRFYVGGRSGMAFQLKTHGAAPGIDLSSGQQANGFFLGAHLGRYLGAELAGDAFQTDLKVPGLGKIGEYGMFSLMPQIRARYPLLDNRLTPYVTAGVGVQVTEFNDRKPPGIGRRIDAAGTSVVGSVGAGIEYFVADNVAWGVDATYLVSRGQEIRIDDHGGHANLDALLVTTSLRLLFPEGPDAPRVYEPPPWRPYFGVRLGGQHFLHERLGGGLEMR